MGVCVLKTLALSMLLKQKYWWRLCLRGLLIQTRDPSFREAAHQLAGAILTPPHCVCQSPTHKHQRKLSEEERRQCKAALGFRRRSSADGGDLMMDQTKRVQCLSWLSR